MIMDIKETMNQAVAVLRSGGLLLYPTDTVWGLGCDATDPEAVAKIFALKKREDSKSLVLLASDLDMVARYIKEIPEMAVQLVEVNDQPMTIIYPGAIASVSGTAACERQASAGLQHGGCRWYGRNQDSDDGFLCGSRQAFRLSDSFDFGEYLRRTYTEEFPGNIAGHQGWSGLYSGPCTGKYIHRQVIVHHQGRSGRYHRDHQKIAGEDMILQYEVRVNREYGCQGCGFCPET